MGSSLRLRIWLTYGILILVVLCTLSFGLVLALSRSPLLYRNAILQVRQGTTFIKSQFGASEEIDQQLENELRQIASDRGLRLFLTDGNGYIKFDSAVPTDARIGAIKSFVINEESTNTNNVLLPLAKDYKGNYWFYAASQIRPNQFLVVAIARPKIILRVFFRDELFLPLLIAGGVAFFLAFILSILLNNWITEPLEKLSQEAEKLAEGQLVTLSQQGPAEIQQLTSSLNRMGQKVKNSTDSQREFIANITHELKTPLTSIQGFAQSIMDGTVEKLENVKQSAKIIFDEAGRMTRLVLDLLSIARLESGTDALKKDKIDLKLIIGNVEKKFSMIAAQNKIQFFNNLPQLPEIMGDGDKLSQVFTNLIDNSIKFTPGGGKITISGELVKNFVEIKIMDTGVGIPDLEKEKIFERFYQLDKSRKGGTNKGVGLGLPIVKQIIKAHFGRIWVESEPGKGSTFIIQLPISTFQVITRISKQLK